MDTRAALDKLEKKPGNDREQLGHKVENILKRYRVNDFFSTTITEEIIFETRPVGRGRPSKISPTEEVTSISLQLHIQQIDDAIKHRITGLMFILNIALRVFTLIEFVVRLALQQTKQSLAGLYDGNPKRKTNRPSALANASGFL